MALSREVLLASYNCSTERKMRCLSIRRRIINLIPKKRRDGNFIKNWRPLTLLNTDFKILAKAIATKTKPYLDKLINSSQTGFMAGRNISHNIRKIMDLIKFCGGGTAGGCHYFTGF